MIYYNHNATTNIQTQIVILLKLKKKNHSQPCALPTAFLTRKNLILLCCASIRRYKSYFISINHMLFTSEKCLVGYRYPALNLHGANNNF